MSIVTPGKNAEEVLRRQAERRGLAPDQYTIQHEDVPTRDAPNRREARLVSGGKIISRERYRFTV